MNKQLVIKNTEIICGVLNKDNAGKYASCIQKFNSVDKDINSFLTERINCISTKGKLYDNRDTIYLYFYENPINKTRDLIGYVSCSASALRAQIDENRENDIIIPTVFIKAFGIDSKYSSKSGIVIFDGKKPAKCSLYILESFLDMMNKLSYKIGITQVYLFVTEKHAAKFWREDCRFSFIGDDPKTALSLPDDHQYMMLYSLANGMSRFKDLSDILYSHP